MRARLPLPLLLLLLLLVAALASCARTRAQLPGNEPIVQQRRYAQGPGALARVAVLPLRATPALTADARAGLAPDEAAGLVSRLMREALQARGVPVVSARDVKSAFGDDAAAARLAPGEAAALAARDLGASSVLIGELLRFREPALGAGRPASVAFQLALHEAPGGFRLWTSRFDHTQRTLTDAPLLARRYPGAGTRWLSAEELARWGAGASAEALVTR